MNNIYKLNYGVIIAPQSYSLDTICNTEFTETEHYAAADVGMYGFMDGLLLAKITKKTKSEISAGRYYLLMPETNNDFNTKLRKLATKSKLTITSRDFINLEKEDNIIVGYLYKNGFGDGSFRIFKGNKDIYFIISSDLEKELLKCHGLNRNKIEK